MDIDKFRDIFGTPLDVGDYPEYILSYDAAANCALININKFFKVEEWMPFIIEKVNDKEGYLIFDKDKIFSLYFIQKVFEFFEPDEYGFYTDYSPQIEKEIPVLVFKKGKIGIMVAPVFNIDEESNKIYFDNIKKKIPSSVFVL